MFPSFLRSNFFFLCGHWAFVTWFISTLKFGLPLLLIEVFQTKIKTELFWVIRVSSKRRLVLSKVSIILRSYYYLKVIFIVSIKSTLASHRSYRAENIKLLVQFFEIYNCIPSGRLYSTAKNLIFFKGCHYIMISLSFWKIETKNLNWDPYILIFLVLGTTSPAAY